MAEPNLNELMKRAQEMQKKMQWIQHELTSTKISGRAGTDEIGVEVVMNGRHDVESIIISDGAMKAGKQIVAELTAAAVNDAVRKVEKLSQEKMVKLTKDLGLPAGGDQSSGTEGEQ